jgi:hypothetical protein
MRDGLTDHTAGEESLLILGAATRQVTEADCFKSWVKLDAYEGARARSKAVESGTLMHQGDLCAP